MRKLAAVLVALTVAGCMGSAPPVPPDNYYRLQVPAPAERAERPALPGILSVGAFDADGLLRARPLLFSEADKEQAVRQHHYHFWTDSPTRLLQWEMVSYLRQRGLAGSIVTPRMRVRADYELVGKIKRLERILGGPDYRVVVELEIAVIRQSDRRLIVEDTYVAEIRSADESVESSVDALNQALSRAFETFAGAVVRSDQTAGR